MRHHRRERRQAGSQCRLELVLRLPDPDLLHLLAANLRRPLRLDLRLAHHLVAPQRQPHPRRTRKQTLRKRSRPSMSSTICSTTFDDPVVRKKQTFLSSSPLPHSCPVLIPLTI